MRHPRQGILVIQSLGLGDLVFSIPVIKVLKKNFPGERLVFLTNLHNHGLLSFIPEVDEVIFYNSKSPLELLLLIEKVRTHAFRMVVVLNPIFRGSLLAWLSGAPSRIGYFRDYEHKQSLHGLERFLLTHAYEPRDERIHEVERYLDLLRMFGLQIPEKDVSPRLDMKTELQPHLNQKPADKEPVHRRPTVAINAGAAWNMRCWPEERFAEIADWIAREYKAEILFLGNKDEKEHVAQITGKMHGQAKSLVGQTDLVQLTAVLSQCDLFLTNDTGPMHIAASLGVPTIAFFGPGDPVKVGPLSPKAKILHHPMPCSPCQFQYTNRCENNLCMQEISVEEVKKAISGILGESNGESRGEEPPTKASRGSLAASRKVSKILYLQSTSEIAGTDITLLRTVELLDKEKYEIHVVFPHEGPLVEHYRKAGCRIHFVPAMVKLTRHKGFSHVLKYAASYVPCLFHLTRLIRAEGIDLVHTNTIHNLQGFLAARAAGRPHVWHIREIVVQSRLVRWLEVGLVKLFSTRFIVMSNAIGEMFLGKRRGFPRNIVKLYDGIDLEEFHPGISGKRIRGELEIPDSTPLVGTVTRLDPWKGIEIFLEAARHVLAEMPNVQFLVCGGEIEGHQGYEQRLRKRAEELGVGKSVSFTGWKYRHDDIPEVYGALDVSVQCPIYPEPYGLANLEAMACGVPVVAVDLGGPKELCLDGKTGHLVPPNQPRAVADAILKILKNLQAARAMGEEGRERAEFYFDRRRCVRNLEKIYDEVLNPRP